MAGSDKVFPRKIDKTLFTDELAQEFDRKLDEDKGIPWDKVTHKPPGSGGLWFGDYEPDDKTVIWVDTTGEDE